MSAPAIGASPALKRARTQSASVQATAAFAVRLAAFFGLCAIAVLHWAALIQPTDYARALSAALIATACGGLLAMTARLPQGPALVVRVGLVVVAGALAVSAMGIPLKLLLPAGWDTLRDRFTGGISVVGSVTEWPYSGPNTWLRLTTLSAAPIVATIAAAVAFWPSRRLEEKGGLRFSAMALLITMYCVAVAARPFGHQGLRGVILLAAIAAWMWLPRLRGRDAALAAVAVGVVALGALGMTAKLASSQPWIDYRHWSWTLHKEKTVTFDWRHSYGPIKWPRKGKTLLLVKSPEAHYWRAETLDRFDGYRWTTIPVSQEPLRTEDVVHPERKNWNERVEVTVRGMESQLVFGPGTPYEISDSDRRTIILSNGAYVVDGAMKAGDTYSIRGYVPDPSAKQMRAAATPDPSLAAFTRINIPDNGAGITSTEVAVPLRGDPDTGNPDADAELATGRYSRIYQLAKRVTAGAATNYDIVRRIGAYLEGDYTYSEHPPRSQFPIEAFLFQNKSGYCQQFSGAAALMLRMLGIPTRIASGFAPGTKDKKTKEFVVRDLDAHSWIEVWFDDIGWVPFDPTPALAPAASQSVALAAASAARGNTADRVPKKDLNKLLGVPEVARGGGGGLVDAGGTPWGRIALVTVLLALLLAGIVTFVRRMRARRPTIPACGDPDVDHLVRLLARLGLDVGPGTTLFTLESRLQRLGGPEASAYARRIRERRFGTSTHAGAGGVPAPSRADRRHFRHVMADAVEAGPLTRLQLALPDDPGAPFRALKLVRIERTR